jgi:alkylation response protein AidB-like acyl-CoA dehydrogenase
LWDAGLLGITLDPAYEGQGLTDEYQKVFNEEVAHYEVPPIGEAVTTGICAPTRNSQYLWMSPVELRGDLGVSFL